MWYKKKHTILSLIILFIVIILALRPHILTETQISHFSETRFTEFEKDKITTVHLFGQYKSKNGFFVGEEIEICAIIQLDDQGVDLTKDFLEKKYPFFLSIENSEDSKDYKKDISKYYDEGNVDDFFVNPGLLHASFDESKKIIKLKGRVVFTKEGKLSFATDRATSSIGFLLNMYNLTDTGIYVYPFYDKFQMESSKIIESLAIIAVGLALIAIIVTYRKDESENNKGKIIDSNNEKNSNKQVKTKSMKEVEIKKRARVKKKIKLRKKHRK